VFVRLGNLKTYTMLIHHPFSSLHCLSTTTGRRQIESVIWLMGLWHSRMNRIFGDQMHLLLYFLSGHSWIVCAWAQ